MKGQTNRQILDSALQQSLRNRMTDAERLLWQHLRGRQVSGCKFRRQHPFMDYVLDFVCLEKGLIVEVDGGQHQGSEKDVLRDQRLREAGFRVLRFWNNQVLQETQAVVEVIFAALPAGVGTTESDPSPPQPSPLKGEEHGE